MNQKKNQKEETNVVVNDSSEKSSFSLFLKKDLTINVNQGDTLSKILRQIGGGNLTADQIMEVLLRVNPNAFIDNNINYFCTNFQLIIPLKSFRDISVVSINLTFCSCKTNLHIIIIYKLVLQELY